MEAAPVGGLFRFSQACAPSLRRFPELLAMFTALRWGMIRESPKFRELPEDCTCLGEGPAPVGRVPRFGAMPELVTYECPACGHVETIEIQPATSLPIGER